MTLSNRSLLLTALMSLSYVGCTDPVAETAKTQGEVSDTSDASDVSGGTEDDNQTDPTDTGDTTDPSDQTEPSDESDATDPSDQSDSTDATDSTDSSDITGPDIIVDPPIAEPVDPCQDPTELEATCEGAAQPQWSLEDFHPASPRFGESYGLEVFEGTVTLVSLHAAWCGYCRTQALYMDQMLGELRAEGYEVEFITVNKINAAEEGYQLAMIYQLTDQNEIQYDNNGEPIYRCTYPLVQDVEEINAWELHAGKKDDFYIYGTDGLLARFLPSGTEDFSTRLSTEEGYNNLKGAIIDVLEGVETVEEETETETESEAETD